MLLTEVTIAFILKSDVVISLPNILFVIINDISLIIKEGDYIKVFKSLLNSVHFIFPSIIIKSHFKISHNFSSSRISKSGISCLRQR